MLDDYRTAPISDRDRALFAFIDKLNHTPGRMSQGDVDELKRLGWSEEAVYDAVTVCAVFNFYNRWIDGTGVRDMPAAAYEATGKRLKEQGYFNPGAR